VLIALAGLFAYYNSLHGAYVLDDGRLLTDPDIDHPFYSSMAPRPVVSISFALNHRLDGFQPRGYHLFNLLVHVAAAITLFDLVRRTLRLPHFAGRFADWSGWVGLASALLWLVHPLQTQSVTYIIQRCESMMGMFFLLALWCFLRGATAVRRKAWWYAGAFLACALGSGCKELMLALPPLALVYDRTFLSGSWRQALRARWPVFLALSIPPVIGIGALVLTGFMTDPKGTVGFGVKVYTPTTYLLTQTTVILHYLRLSFWPVGLTIDYLDWPPARTLADCWPAALAVGGMLLATTYGVIRGRAWGFLGAWFFLILAPTSSFIPLQDAVFEHRMYLPLAAVVVLVVTGVSRVAVVLAGWTGGRRVYGVALAGTVAATAAVLAFMTVVRNEDYSSPSTLYADNVAKRPHNARVRQNLAIHLFAEGRVAEAAEQLAAAQTLLLHLPNLQTEHVRILRESGQATEAAEAAAKFLAAQPDSDEIVFELGLSLLADGRPAEAEPYLRRAAEKQPTNKFARAHHGVSLMQTGHLPAADAEFQASHALDPSYAGQLIRTARRTALSPDAKPANLRLVAWYADAACRMQPEPSAEYLDTLAICQARAGHYPEAVVSAGKAAAAARKRGDEYLASRIDARASLFRAGKPYLPE
jgi:Flp pilus assembly protein TadD